MESVNLEDENLKKIPVILINHIGIFQSSINESKVQIFAGFSFCFRFIFHVV